MDAQLQSEQQVEYDCVQADRILALMEASGAKVNIIILDACRNNPFERSWTRSDKGNGLAFMNAPSGTLIAHSTAPGKTASDGSGNNSPYTSAILESMKIPNITIIQMFQNVRSIVSQKSNKQQIPWESTSMTGDFYLNSGKNIQYENQAKLQEPTSIQTTLKLPPTDKTKSQLPSANKSTSQLSTSNEITFRNTNDIIIDSRDKVKYKTVKIGTQVWMAENLKATNYRNGDLIGTTAPSIKDISKETTPKYQWAYNGNEGNVDTYGRLYTWYAITDSRNVCPTGWHVPSDAEWTSLTTLLGGESVAGGKLKETGTTHWISPNLGATNETGFTALPGGNRGSNGSYSPIGSGGYWWRSTEYSSTSAWMHSMGAYDPPVSRGYSPKQPGMSVRCLKD